MSKRKTIFHGCFFAYDMMIRFEIAGCFIRFRVLIAGKHRSTQAVETNGQPVGSDRRWLENAAASVTRPEKNQS